MDFSHIVRAVWLGNSSATECGCSFMARPDTVRDIQFTLISNTLILVSWSFYHSILRYGIIWLIHQCEHQSNQSKRSADLESALGWNPFFRVCMLFHLGDGFQTWFDRFHWCHFITEFTIWLRTVSLIRMSDRDKSTFSWLNLWIPVRGICELISFDGSLINLDHMLSVVLSRIAFGQLILIDPPTRVFDKWIFWSVETRRADTSRTSAHAALRRSWVIKSLPWLWLGIQIQTFQFHQSWKVRCRGGREEWNKGAWHHRLTRSPASTKFYSFFFD